MSGFEKSSTYVMVAPWKKLTWSLNLKPLRPPNNSKMKPFAGLIFDDSRHYIDHLAPFCALHGCPLIVCDGSVADLARRYYPGLDVIERTTWDLSLPDNIVACDPRPLIE